MQGELRARVHGRPLDGGTRATRGARKFYWRSYAAAGLFMKSLRVFLNHIEVAEHMLHGCRNRLSKRIAKIGKPIVNPDTIPASFHESRGAQIRKMPRGLGLRYFQAVMDVTDTHLPIQQQAHNSQARHICKSFKKPFQLA